MGAKGSGPRYLSNIPAFEYSKGTRKKGCALSIMQQNDFYTFR